MADGLVPALIKFGETLSDRSVEASQKLRVLNALNDVKLTLTELSESGLGKKVSQLKNEPGDLGTTARGLVSKWKTLLKDYLRWESTQLARGVKSAGDEIPLEQNSELNPDSTYGHSLKNGYEKSRTSDRSCHDVPDVQNSSSLVKRLTKTATTSRPSEYTSVTGSLEASSSATATTSSCSSPFITTAATKNNNTVTASTSSSLKHSSIPSDDHYHGPLISEHDAKKSKRKRKPVDDSTGSIDASSGLSFMESLCAGSTSHPTRKKRSKLNKTASSPNDPLPNPTHIPARNPVRPSASFTAEVLSSLEDDVDRPDVVNHSLSSTRTGPGIFDDDDDDGNLKFKSKKVLWVPKPSRTVLPRVVGLSGTSGAVHGSSPNPEITTPPSLIDLCLAVIERNLSRVDHVGQVPYELLGRALRHSTPVELAHIEQCNPQFVGCSDDLWQRHVQREFQHAKEHSPRPDETWCEFYTRLANDEEKRLDRIINRSARKIKEELQTRRVTRPIEAIPPRQVQKRARQCGLNPIASTSSNTNNKSTTGYRPFGEPTNVSRPSPNPLTPRSSSLGVNEKGGVVTSGANSTMSKPNGGGLLNKLRKQFQLGRLR